MKIDKQSFLAGICCALQVVSESGEGVLWREIVEMAGRKDITAHAKRYGQMRTAGFMRHEKLEFGNRG